MTAAERMRSAAVVVLAVALGLLGAAPGWAHKEGLTPYRYVVAPPGVSSEGPPESGVSTQKLDRPGFAGTTDNQMQLTLPEGALPVRSGERGVRVTLQQLDPADLPDLPDGLEPEGNAYRVDLVYSASKNVLRRLARPATLGLSAPAAPTALYQLVDKTWQSMRYTPATADEGYTSVVKLIRPGTFLQAYDPATAPPPVAAATPVAAPDGPTASEPDWSPALAVVGAAGLLLFGSVFHVLGRRRARARSTRRAVER